MYLPVWQAARTLGQGLLELVYPSICWICQRRDDALRDGVCAGCLQQLTHDPHVTCPRCSSTVGQYVDLESGCVHCRAETFAFDQAVRLGQYDGLLRDTVLRMKSPGGAALAEVMGAVWACHGIERLRSLQADVVIPVPLHWTRRWRRGFNQSELLAQALAARLGVKCPRGWLFRARPTPPQTRQTPPQRRENVRGAFRVRAETELRGKTVLLVDDVMTTGSTVHEAARALRTAQPARIAVAVLAHGR